MSVVDTVDVVDIVASVDVVGIEAKTLLSLKMIILFLNNRLYVPV